MTEALPTPHNFNAGDRVIVRERAGYIKWSHVNYLGEGRPSVYVVFDDGAENGWQLISSIRPEDESAPEQTVMHTNNPTPDLELTLLRVSDLLFNMMNHNHSITEYTHRLAHCETRVFAEQYGTHDGERLLALLAWVTEASTAGALLAAYPHPLVPQHVIVTADGMPVMLVITESGLESEVLCDRLRELFALFGPWSLSGTADARENEIMEDDK